MRILMISDHADPLADIGSKEAGGQNIYVYNLARFLAKEGIYVDIFTRWDRKNKNEVVKRNHHLRVIRVKAGPKKYMPRDDFLNIIPDFLKNIKKRVVQEKENYDLIHTNYWYSGIAGLELSQALKIPLVHVYHSIGKIRYDALKNYAKQDSDYEFYNKRTFYEKMIANNSTAVISTSPVEQELVREVFELKSDNSVKVIPIGINPDIFYPLDKSFARSRIDQSNNSRLVLYVGRIEWRKGIGTLLHAFGDVVNKHPGSRLLIVGGGRTKSEKELERAEQDRQIKIINDLNLNGKVEYIGPVDQKKLRYYYNAADVSVVPSYYEPFGIVPLESMACGTPVVASNTGGLKYTVIPNVSGELAEVRDANDLSQKINKILDREKSYYMKGCLERAKKFDWSNIAKEYATFFQELRNEYEDSNAGAV